MASMLALLLLPKLLCECQSERVSVHCMVEATFFFLVEDVSSGGVVNLLMDWLRQWGSDNAYYGFA